ncbi:MAG: phosphatase PAP2 family protein [Gemmatimonadaceae bacterium]|nr:phosphatase PAP2 family protein [Gemmatimonadaceae bacterium]
MDSERSSALRALRSPKQWLTFGVVAVTALVAAHLLDETAWKHWRDLKVNDRDWGRLLRSMGYLPTWLFIAAGVWLHDRGRPRWGWRGGALVVAPLLGGTCAELLKMLVRRLRPDPDVFGYVWRPFAEDFISTRGLGMPSSHVMVAFAGAAAMARVFPRGWWLWYLLAAGCAAARVLALGHFLSDAVAAALAGYVVGVLLSRSGGFGRSLESEPPDESIHPLRT